MRRGPNTLIIYDYETSGLEAGDPRDPEKYRNEILQIGAVAYDFATLRPIQDGQFVLLLRPLYFDRLDAKSMEVNGIKIEDLENPEKAVSQKDGWNAFVRWVQSYNPGKGWITAPYKGGKNQRAFDTRFTDVMNALYAQGEKTVLFNNRLDFDLEDEVLRWWQWNDDLPDSKMDTLRRYLGMPVHPYHDALVDAKEEGWMLVKFLQYYRKLHDAKDGQGEPKVKLEGAYKREMGDKLL